MRFVCDSCRAQYMISDDKVGPNGVKVRCKKCSYVIFVQKTQAAASPEPEAFDPDATQVMENPFGESGLSSGSAEGPTNPRAVAPPVERAGGKSSSFLASVPDDEIGAVFDRVLSSGAHSMSESANASQSAVEGDGETRVLDPAIAKRLAEESAGPSSSEGQPENPAIAEAANYDWFVAIDEKQTGPLTLHKVKRHWDEGEIGPDSLCWRAGFADWMPLSEVVELKSVLAPKPPKAVIVAPVPVAGPAMAAAPVTSAFAAGGDSSATAAVAPNRDGEWRPVAASALASLVREEMDVLQKPEVKPRSASSSRSDAGRSLLEFPTPPEPSGANGHGSALPAGAAVPSNGAAQGQQISVFPTHGAQAPQTHKYWRYVAIGALTLLVLALVVGSFLMGENRAATPRPVPPPAPVATTAKPDLPMPPPPQPKVIAEPKVEPPVPQVKEAAPTLPRGERPADRANSYKVDRSMREPTGSPSRRRERSGKSKVAATEPEAGNPGGEVILPASPGEKAADDAFEREFGGPKKEVARREEPRRSGKGPSVYIPPAPGSGADLPEQLEFSDILQVVLANKPKLTSCRDEQKKKDPNVGGTLVMGWTILPNGRTSNILVVSEELKATYFANCVAGAIKGWTFPSHRKHNGQVVEGVPFKF